MDVDKILILIRGLPGSGKSTLAIQLCDGWDQGGENYSWFEADHYFEEPAQDGLVYKFVKEDLHKAHTWCYNTVDSHMEKKVPTVIVSNTFTTKKEYMPYIELADKWGYKVQVIDLYGDFGNVHNVPEGTLKKMKERWKPFDRSLL